MGGDGQRPGRVRELGERLGAWWFEEQQRGAVGCSEVTGVGGRGRDRAGLVGGP